MKKKDREGRLIKSLDPMSRVGTFLMKERNDATNFFSDHIEVSHAEAYIHEKKKAGYSDFNLMYVILAAYVRTVAQHPDANRFIRGLKLYARNYIEIAITIKIEMKVNSPETVVKVIFPADATADDVYRILHEEIDKARNANGDFEGVAKALNYAPRFLLRGVVGILKIMDYFGGIPKFLRDISPMHASLVLTSMGSLRIRPVFHHLYNFGTVSTFVAFGTSYISNELQDDGSVKRRKYVDINLSMDERITDGYGYAAFLHCWKHIMQNPAVLDSKPEKIVDDIP